MLSADDEKHLRKLLRKKDKTEVLAWLEGSENRNVGEMTHKAALAMVRRLYSFATLEIVAVDIGANAGFESTDTLIAKLSDDKSSRQKIFDWNNERVIKMGYEPEQDEGQDYLLIWFD